MINSASKVILYDGQGFLVMQQRDAGSKAKNKRTFFGGGIEKGESPKVAALRELEEETNIKATMDELTRVYSKFVWNTTELIRVHYYQLNHPIATDALEVFEGRGFVVVDPKTLRRHDGSLSPLVRRIVKNIPAPTLIN